MSFYFSKYLPLMFHVFKYCSLLKLRCAKSVVFTFTFINYLYINVCYTLN